MKKLSPAKIRKTWLINPRTRVKKSKKLYRRQRAKQLLRKQSGEVKSEV